MIYTGMYEYSYVQYLVYHIRVPYGTWCILRSACDQCYVHTYGILLLYSYQRECLWYVRSTYFIGSVILLNGEQDRVLLYCTSIRTAAALLLCICFGQKPSPQKNIQNNKITNPVFHQFSIQYSRYVSYEPAALVLVRIYRYTVLVNVNAEYS